MKRNISILIPTHNRSEILSRTMKSLSEIRIPVQAEVEVIVVANACTDDTEELVSSIAPEMPMPTRCVVEAEAGLNAARNRAAMEARGDILAYLDDDVWVDPDWLVGLCEVYDSEPADIVGGRVLLWWDAVSPPTWMCKDFETMLSGSDHGEDVFEVPSKGMFCMLGANFSFSRETLAKVGSFRPGLDRTGKSLLAGGETEFLLRAREAGLRMFYAPRACVKHWVAPHRIESKYLHRLAFDAGRTGVFLTQPKPKWKWVPTVLGRPFRGLVGLGGEMLARLSGNESVALSRRLGAVQCLGRAAGAVQVILGSGPLKGKH